METEEVRIRPKRSLNSPDSISRIKEKLERRGKQGSLRAPVQGRIRRHFTMPGLHPFDEIEWEERDVGITDDHGKVIFEQKGIEVPVFWSQTAINVVASKYFRGAKDSNDRESSIRHLITRVTDTICAWGRKDGYFKNLQEAESFNAELSYILVNQYAAFNSPVWFNVGVQDCPQCSACFIVSVDDSLDSLLELQTIEAKLFKYGSGTGSNLSTIRSSKERLKGGGVPSGPVSFMRGYDAWAGIIKSGGKTRRAAKMQILSAEHPDVVEFITCKSNEEKRAWALIEQGYDGGFAVPGGAYDSVFFQNSNLSVRVSDEFMEAVEKDGTFYTRRVTDGEICECLKAAEVMRKIAEGTHVCGDPGLQFDTTINKWHTTPNSGRINASNPCSEYMHVDNSACNLASINLLRYLDEDGEFDVAGFKHTVDVLITAQDILIDNSSYPTKRIGKNAQTFRQLGLGYANLGAALMCQGLPYDSVQGREWAAAVTSIMTGEAYKMSGLLARDLGSFAEFEKNREPMLEVIAKHRDAAQKLSGESLPLSILSEAQRVWDEALDLGENYGYRNAQATVLAPTGTISFMMDCDTTGIEPDIALVKYKRLAGGGLLKLVNQSVVRALRTLQYAEDEIAKIVEYIDQKGTIEGCELLKVEHLPVFDCAFRAAGGTRSIHYLGHLSMMAATQPFISGAISKTVNLPKEATVDEIFDIYVRAWREGIKAVALYRDGSKRTQPVSAQESQQEEPIAKSKPIRRRLPDERQAITHKFSVGGLEGYLTVGLYEDGSPGEIFLVVAKEGSTLSGVMDAFATSISIALQYGVPLGALAKKFSHMRFEPSGFTQNKDIPLAKSIVDYMFRWMSQKFLSLQEQEALGLASKQNGNGEAKLEAKEESPDKADFNAEHVTGSNGSKNSAQGLKEATQLIMSTFHNSEDAPPCTACGSSMMVRQAGCYVCLNCGAQGGCG
ncbi:MAG: vitamin B12-dependent ribonucleotide reductase [Deltaproteobacteria bacterium]|nr:vitamin B12-dependent ribonucleotide reductase [Deltaproteobacteria bacterium]